MHKFLVDKFLLDCFFVSLSPDKRTGAKPIFTLSNDVALLGSGQIHGAQEKTRRKLMHHLEAHVGG